MWSQHIYLHLCIWKYWSPKYGFKIDMWKVLPFFNVWNSLLFEIVHLYIGKHFQSIYTFLHLCINAFRSFVYWETHLEQIIGTSWPACVIMYFLKWACKTILVPLKHVLHLVWSAYVTSKAIKIALKVELLRFFLYSWCFIASPWLGQIMISRKKKSKNNFLLKICFRH